MLDLCCAGTENIKEQNVMQNLPLVSIVTPAYNQAGYLAQTIESVLAQDYPKLEYIVLDDGSSDDTPAILARYDGRICHQRHVNVGQARTLNKGWTMARGSLVGYLSSDDCLHPQAVSRLVQTLANSPDAVVAYCDFELIDAAGRAFRTVRTEDYNTTRLHVDLVCQPGPGALFRREVFDQTGGWAEELRQVPDFEFWLRASCLGPFVRVPEVLAGYRIHEGSASFTATTADRSMEIVSVMLAYWDGQIGAEVERSMAAAHLIAAKSHVQSGRLTSGFSQLLHAVYCQPSTIWSQAAWRMLLSGLSRRAAYQILRRGK